MVMGTGGELGLERSELRPHLLHSQMGFPRCWSQAQKKPPAEKNPRICCSWASVQQGNSNRISLVALRTFLGNPMTSNTRIFFFFFPWNNVSPSLSSLQDNFGCSCPQSNKHSGLSFLQQLCLAGEQGEPKSHACGKVCRGQKCPGLGC